MTQAAETSDTTTSTHPLVESNRVEGTPVYSLQGKHVGTIHHLIIEWVTRADLITNPRTGKLVQVVDERPAA